MIRLLAIAFVATFLVCASADDASARCRSGRWFPGKALGRGVVWVVRDAKPARRAIKGAAIVVTAPARVALGNPAFRPQSRCTRLGGCH